MALQERVRHLRAGAHRHRCSAFAVTLAVAALAASTALVATPAGAQSLNYVALGDSYTAGAGITPAAPFYPACLQSAVNYPHLVAASQGLSLNDRSCSGATSADMTSSQYSGLAPQFSALSSSTNVVTLGIGGNDHGLFVHALVDCGLIDIFDFFNFGAPCKAIFGNTWSNDISSDASTIGGVIRGIHTYAPNARVFVVGYPDILPQSGNCYPTMPLTTGDVAYLNGVEQQLNSMLASEAAANGATFVNTFTQSIGHDACKAPSVRWVNPIIPSGGGISVHPNPAGERAMASAVTSALVSAGL